MNCWSVHLRHKRRQGGSVLVKLTFPTYAAALVYCNGVKDHHVEIRDPQGRLVTAGGPTPQQPVPSPILPEPTPQPVVHTTGQRLRIAVLFRGPIRSSAQCVANNVNNTMQELRQQHNIDSYLATWGSSNNTELKALLQLAVFDNLIVQTPPTDQQIARYVKKTTFGVYPVRNIYRAYYQIKTALDVICDAAEYDYILHSRTDLWIKFGNHLNSWFDPSKYSTPSVGPSWINDWAGMATPDTMQRSWDYGTLSHLGSMIDAHSIPEYILQQIMSENRIDYVRRETSSIYLDPHRVQPGDRL